MDEARQVEVGPDECVALLRTQKFGRLIFEDAGAQIRPVNYVVVADRILIRMDRPFEDASRVVFEIDGVDAIGHEGWSVIVEGRAFSTPLEPCTDDNALKTWAPGAKSWCTNIAIDSVSGRWVKSNRVGPSQDDRGYV